MEIVKEFNGLNGCRVTREKLEKMYDTAIENEQFLVADRISDVLKFEADRFDVELETPAFEQLRSGLMGAFEIDPFNEEQEGLNKAVSPNDILDMITKKMLEMIAESTKSYQKKWKDTGYVDGADVGKFLVPLNFVSKKPYRGINYMMLSNMGRPLENPYFLTFKQVSALKGKVKKGAIGKEVIYYTKLFTASDKEKGKSISSYDRQKVEDFSKENEIPEDKISSYAMLKYYNVFNGSDVEDIDFKLDQLKTGLVLKNVEAKEDLKFPVAEAMIANYPKVAPKMEFHGQRAFYSPGSDKVVIPVIQDFDTMQDYYRTFFHELAHSTGHSKRLSRDFSGKFGSPKYAKEELVAEFAAVFLSAESGIIWYDNHNHAAYLKSWGRTLKAAKDDNKFFISGAAHAQKAYDFVLDFDEKGNPAYFKDIAKFEKEKEEKALEKAKAEKVAEKKKVVPAKVSKKASDYGQKKKFESVKNKYTFSKDDIPYQTAYNAHSGTSFSPEIRAVAEQKQYFQHLEYVFKTNRKKAVELGKLEEFEVKFERYKNGYLKRFLEHLHSKIGFFSTMIAGPANFPVRRMEKKANVINTKLNAIIDFTKYADFFKPETNIIKTGSETALSKLETKLEAAEKNHVRMLAGNKLLKKLRSDKASEKDYKDAFIDLGFDLETAKKEANYMFNYDYAGFFTTNSSAKIRTLKKQIELEKRLKAKAVVSAENPIKIAFDGGTIQDDFTDNRVKIFFDGKPSDEIRSWIKKAGHAFKWSPKNGAWQRQLNTYYKGNRQDLYNFLGVTETSSVGVATTEKTRGADVSDSNPQPQKSSNPIVEKRRFKQGGTADRTMANYSGTRKNEKEIIAFYKKIEEYDNKLLFIEVFEKHLYSNQYKSELDFLKAINLCKIESDCDEILTSIYKPKKEDPVKVDKNGQMALFGANKLKASVPAVPAAAPVPTIGNIKSISDTGKVESSFFKVNGATGEFLQAVERKSVGSVVITLDGMQGAGKTTTLYQFIEDFASAGNKCLFISGEEHPESSLAVEKRDKYLSKEAIQNTSIVAEVESIEQLAQYIDPFEIIFIDSWQKLQRMVGNIRLDEDLRKKFNGKVFVCIFQQTTTGRAKGGAEIVFDGDIIIKMIKEASFADNYAYFDKNRYTKIPIENIRYNIASRTCYNPNEVQDQEQPEEINLTFTPIIY